MSLPAEASLIKPSSRLVPTAGSFSCIANASAKDDIAHCSLALEFPHSLCHTSHTLSFLIHLRICYCVLTSNCVEETISMLTSRSAKASPGSSPHSPCACATNSLSDDARFLFRSMPRLLGAIACPFDVPRSNGKPIGTPLTLCNGIKQTSQFYDPIMAEPCTWHSRRAASPLLPPWLRPPSSASRHHGITSGPPPCPW